MKSDHEIFWFDIRDRECVSSISTNTVTPEFCQGNEEVEGERERERGGGGGRGERERERQRERDRDRDRERQIDRQTGR